MGSTNGGQLQIVLYTCSNNLLNKNKYLSAVKNYFYLLKRKRLVIKSLFTKILFRENTFY